MQLFAPHNTILWNHLKKKYIQLMILPEELLLSYAVTYHLIQPPRSVSKQELKNFLHILPSAHSFELSNEKIGIFCYLNEFLADFIRKKIKWKVIPIRQSVAQSPLEISSYDPNENIWKKPQFLKERNLGKSSFN
jgi:hypothetical protein